MKFIDINITEFDLKNKYGITYKQAMERIQAFKSDGSLIKDIEVFQEAYNLIGLGWIYAPSKLQIFDRVLKYIYIFWAKYRLKLTFRPSIEKLCSSRESNLN